MWWIICIIIAIAFPPSIIPMGIIFVYYLIKSNNERGSSSNSNYKSSYSSNRIEVKCPYCRATIYVDEPGRWRCRCEKVFVYRNSTVYKLEVFMA